MVRQIYLKTGEVILLDITNVETFFDAATNTKVYPNNTSSPESLRVLMLFGNRKSVARTAINIPMGAISFYVDNEDAEFYKAFKKAYESAKIKGSNLELKSLRDYI